MPGLFAMQVRAIAEAAVDRKKAGGDPRPEIMIPLVGAVQELEIDHGRRPSRCSREVRRRTAASTSRR